MDASASPRNRHPRTKRFAEITLIGFALGFVLLLSLPRLSATWVYNWPQCLMVAVLIGIQMLWIAYGLIRGKGAGLTVGWCVGIWAVFLSPVVSLILNHSLTETYLPFLMLTSGVVVFFALANATKSDACYAQFIGCGIGVLGVVVVLVSLYRWSLSDIPTALGLLDPLNRMAGEQLLSFSFAENPNAQPFGHQNYTAGAILLFIPWHAWLFERSRNRIKAIWSLVLVLDIVCLISTFSRGAWIGLAGGSAVFVVWLSRSGRISRPVFLKLVYGIVVVGAIMIAANPRLRSSIVRVATEGSTRVDQIRSSMVQAGWVMFSNNKIFGIGPGNVTTVYPRYRGQLASALEDNYQLHVTPLQIAVEQGVVGLAAWGMLFFAAWRTFRRLDQSSVPVGAAAFFSILTYGIFSLTDYQLDVIPITVLLFVNFAILAGVDSTPANLPPVASQISNIGIACAAVLILVLTWPEFRGRGRFHAAMDRLREGDREQFRANTVDASAVSPFPGYFLNQLAAVDSELWANTTNATENAEHFENATGWFNRSLELNPAQEFCHFNLGWMLQVSDPMASAGHFVRAAKLVPDRKGVYRGLGLSLMGLGRTNEALECFSLECLANPRFVAAAFWSHVGQGEHWPAVYEILQNDLGLAVVDRRKNGVPTRSLEDRKRVLAWFQSGDDSLLKENKWPVGLREFWNAVESNSREPVRETVPRTPWAYLHDAWADEDNREALVTQAVVLSTESAPSEPIVEELVKWVSQDNWRDVVRGIPPAELFRAYGRQRSGFNLLARNMDGLKPTDVCSYVDNHVVELFFGFLYGNKRQVSSIFVLKRLQEIIAGIPELADLVDELPSLETAP